VLVLLVAGLCGGFGKAPPATTALRATASSDHDHLQMAAGCPPDLQVLEDGECTHGPDPAPPGLDPSRRVPPLTASEAGAAAAASDVVCAGPTGNRIQVVYVRYEGSPDNYAAYRDSFRAWAAGVDAIFHESAAETGGVRRALFVTSSSTCEITVARHTIPGPAGDVTNKLKAQGLDRTDRKYLVFLDDDPFCGTAGVPQDEQPGHENRANRGPTFAYAGNGCWRSDVAAHEVLHTIGGVHTSAPHATPRGHCRDDHDRMCYQDAPDIPPLFQWCPQGHERLFDCNHDDYFSTAPAPGSYLATHWNTANSVFLDRGSQSSWAYVHANQPTTASYTPRADRRFNSSGATNTVTRSAVGAYRVRIPGMAAGGMPHATAYGSSPTHCTVPGWGPGGPGLDQLVDVRCFTPTGTPTDSQFTVGFVSPRNRFGAYADLWASQPSTPDYNPPIFNYNSTTTTPAVNRIQRAGVGVYLVWLPGLGPAADGPSAGTAIATATGTTTGWCRASGWGTSGQDVLAVVTCRTASGAPADATFTFTYANQLSLLGLPGGRAAYVLADQETAASSTPDARRQYNSSGELNTIQRTGVGSYTVVLPGLKDFAAGGEGNVQIGAEDQLRERCQVQAWSPFGDDIQVYVRCFDHTGAPTDAEFTLAFSS